MTPRLPSGKLLARQKGHQMLIAGIAGIIFVVLVAALLIFASTRPDAFRVERSIHVDAPPTGIAPLIDDFHNWKSWSPWEHLDPNMKTTYSGAPTGPGAIYEWEGNNKAGKGRMEITSETASTIDIKLDFLKPFHANNTSIFTLTPAAGGTSVSWAMLGKRPFMMKVMCTFINFDNMIGKDFDKGLASMKSAAESHS